MRGSAVKYVSLFGKRLVFCVLVSNQTSFSCTPVIRAPDTSKVKQKMLYASSKDALRKKLVGIGTEIQATDASEIAYETVLEKVKSI